MTTDAMVQAVYDAASHLDIQARAWVVGIGRLVHSEVLEIPDEALMREILDAAYASGEFPAGPLGYLPDRDPVRVNPEFHVVSLTHATPQRQPFLELRIGFGVEGFVAVGFTRSGRFGDNEVQPSHVLLADVEAVTIDVGHLLALLAKAHDYRGDCEVVVSVACDVPGDPVRLRAYDETIGELIPAERSPAAFDTLVGQFRTPVDRPTFHRYGWDLATQAVTQFGVSVPQLFVDPAKGTPPARSFGHERGEPSDEQPSYEHPRNRRPRLQVMPDPR